MNLTRVFVVAFGAALVATAGLQGAAGATGAMHVKVTGKDYAGQLSAKSMPAPQGVVRLDHQVWGGRQEASDQRAAGRYRSTFDTWEYRDGRVHFADMTFSLKNAKGSWAGASIGARSTDGSHFIRAVAYGRGAYRGLRYVAIFHDKASGTAGTHLLDIDGWIDRGTAPARRPVATDDVHVKVTGKSTPDRVLPDQWAGFDKTSDPRTSGRYRTTMKLWTYPDGRMHFLGKYELSSELGTWKGEWHGIVTSDRRYVRFVDALGTGDLAGLRYRHVDVGRFPKSAPAPVSLSVNGWIESIEAP